MSPTTPTTTTERRDDEDRYFDIEGLARYSGLSISTVQRHLRQKEHPIPHAVIRAPGKTRGRLLIRKADFDAWVASFAPRVAAPDEPDGGPTDTRWVRRGFGK